MAKVGGAEEIPDGTNARVGMFSARFDRGPTETLFRGVYQILKEKNYPVLMVDAAASKNFGEMTAAYLGKLEDEKGVLLAVCTPHYAEKTDSRYSSYEELRVAHENGLDILPLRVCDDPWPPKPPSGPEHQYDKMGAGAGLLKLAIGKATVYVDCRGKDANYIAAQIAETLLPGGRRPSGHGKAEASTTVAPEGAASHASPSTAKAASPKDAEAAGFLPSPPTAASTGPEAKGADPGASSSTPQGPIAAALRKGMAGGSKDLAASVADAAATAEPKAQGPGEEAKALVPSASPSPADVKEAEAFWNLGVKGGGERNGQSYSQKACFVKALELNENFALVWRNLGVVGGGTVKGRHYDAKACYRKTLEVDEKYAVAWSDLGFVGGGTVKGWDYDAKACYVKALEVDEKYAGAWNNLGNTGGGTVNGQAYNRKACYVKALEVDEKYAGAWNNLGNTGGGTVKGQAYDAKVVNRGAAALQECILKALELDEKNANYWDSLGDLAGGGTVKGRAYDKKDCFERALELSENHVNENVFWRNLGNAGGGTVRGTHYSPDECKAKAKGK
ncbi:Ogt [Symbiodinium sp. CCMP2592]|nr:Ogt [Symbiodinium sp. CCMP2592]